MISMADPGIFSGGGGGAGVDSNVKLKKRPQLKRDPSFQQNEETINNNKKKVIT